MANKQSAKKAIRQDIKRRAQNRSVRSSVNTLARKVLALIEKQDVGAAVIAVRAFESLATRAGRKNIISSHMVSRRVSRFNVKINQISPSVSS